ncbi:hypothetical protein GOM49_12945 [Clostridium bovifaecis]|uniref:ATP-grasp domain-containing protein n=1 Tax=Clostridium bovifaecis TaxID=2184719 RepID=A0A6I6EY42_9CLOT|nr:hypothetical protein GOM49_12945 [Clostridium bovifaecis]
MSNYVYVKENLKDETSLIINHTNALQLGLVMKSCVYISFGTEKQYVNIKICENISNNEIYLPQKIISALRLPLYVQFEVKVKENQIILGPYIGILLTKDSNKINEGSLRRLLNYVLDYPKLHGAVVVFALDKVNKNNHTIEGYCYNPSLNSWNFETLSYPQSIYRRVGLNPSWKNHFLSSIGDTLYNNYYFNKFEMYEWLSKFHEIKKHLPHTILYEFPEDILSFLYNYKKILVKPISGMQGKGIVQISYEGDNIVFKYRKELKNIRISFKSEDEAISLIESLFTSKKHIVQRHINLLKHYDSVIDFRVIMQKDESTDWVCNGIIGRIGEKESIVSNISSNGSAYLVEDLFRRFFSNSEVEIYALKEKFISLAAKICTSIDHCGVNCGTLGLDLCIDTDGKMWLIEINNRDPDPTIALDAKDKFLYYKIKSSTLLYGKALSGFKT